MSTLQHTRQPTFQHRLWLVVVIIGAAAALTVALVAINSGSSTSSGKAASVSGGQTTNWLDNVAAARSAIGHGEPAPVAPDVAAQRNTLAATSSAIASRASARSAQVEPEALVESRFRHQGAAGQR